MQMLWAIVASFTFLPTLAAADDAVQAVVAKAIAAHGGEAKVAKLKAMQWGGEMRATVPGMGEMTVTWKQTWRLPDHVRDVQEMDLKGAKFVKIQVSAGDRFWVSTNGRTQELKDEMRTKMQEEMYPEVFDKLIPLTDKKYVLSSIDEMKVAGEPAAGIKVASKGHRDVKLYFDKDSGLLVKRENQIANEKGELVRLELFYSDFKEFEGVKLYRKAEAFTDGNKFADITITEIKFFDKLGDDVFAKP